LENHRRRWSLDPLLPILSRNQDTLIRTLGQSAHQSPPLHSLTHLPLGCLFTPVGLGEGRIPTVPKELEIS
jgi:hypothetical protein